MPSSVWKLYVQMALKNETQRGGSRGYDHLPPATSPSEDAIETADFLRRHRTAIMDVAADALRRRRIPHYEAADPDEVRERLETLFDRLVDAAGTRDLGVALAYTRRLAEERFSAGYDLSDVQTAFNTLEETVWSWIFSELEPEQFAGVLGLVSTIFGAMKDALARDYVFLATRAHVPSPDLRALVAGAETSWPSLTSGAS